MIADKKFSLDRFRLELDATASVFTSGIQTHGGASVESFHNDPLTGVFGTGAYISCDLNQLGASVTRTFTASIPYLSWAPADVVVAGTGAMQTNLDFVDPVLYCTLNILTGFPIWYMEWSDIEWYVNGVLEASYGSGSTTGYTLNPSSVPFFGAFCEIAAGAETLPIAPGITECPDLQGSSFSRYAESSVTGGYSYQEGGVWVTPSVTLETTDIPTAGACTLEYVPTCTGTVSNDVTVSARYEATAVAATSSLNMNASARVFIVPDWPRRWLKLVNNVGDFRVMAERTHMPAVKRHRTASCTVSGVSSTFYEETDVIPDGSTFLDVVGSDTEPIEDAAQRSSPCLYIRGYSHEKMVGTTCYVTRGQEGIDYVGRVTNPPILDYPDGTTDIGRFKRYVDTWVNPWWSYGMHFEEWDVLGDTPAYPLYWPQLGDQWVHSGALPPLKDRQTRTSIQSDVLAQGPIGVTMFWRLYYGNPRLGVGNLKVDSATLPSSKTLTSASQTDWTLTDCTVTWGADMVVNPSASTCELEYDLGSWDNVPYQYPRFCRVVNLSWVSTNISAVRAYIVGVDGEETLLELDPGDGFTTSGEDYSLYDQNQSKYAGSWAQDYGAGFTTDLGADLDGDGISTATMADPERVASFNLLDGGQPDKLRIEVDVVDTAVDFTFHYPQFKAVNTDKKVFWESRQAFAVVFDNGPGLRVGNQNWESGGATVSPPAVRAPASPTTVTDWLAWKRAYVLGTDPTTGVDTDLASIYDSYEGQTIEDGATHCHSFMMPFRLGNIFYQGLVNAYDTPPLALAPLKALNTRDWDRDGARTLEIVQQSVEPKYGVTDGGTPMHWRDSSDVQWTSTQILPLFRRWTVTKHLHAVDNNESLGTWYKGDKDMGSMRPWHGAYALWDSATPTGTAGQWCWQDRLGRYQRVTTNASGIEFSGVDWSRPYPGFDRVVQVTSDPTDTNPKMFEDIGNRRLFIVFDKP